MDRSNEWIEQQRQQFQEAGTVAAVAAGGAKKKFPMQLYRMLEAVEGTNHSLIVRWLPHGRAFVVLDKTRFETEVLPLYFPQQSRYASFQRQLNIYGFLRQTRDDDGYYHELFLRARPGMAAILPRESQGRYAVRQTFDPASEPDFYTMPWLPDVLQSCVEPRTETNSIEFANTASKSIFRPLPISHSVLSSSQMARPARTARLKSDVATTHAMEANTSGTADTLLTFSQSTGYVAMRSSHEESPLHGHSQFLTRISTGDLDTVETSQAPVAVNHGPEYSTSFALDHAAGDVPDAQHFYGVQPPQLPRVETAASAALDEDEMDTICPESPAQRRATKLDEWANFLHDVDFETSSSSSGEKKKKAR
jgi:HSF-type DNA-binding